MPTPTFYSAATFINKKIEGGKRHNSHIVILADRDNTFNAIKKENVKIEEVDANITFDLVAINNGHDNYRRLHITFALAKYGLVKIHADKDDKRPKSTPSETGQITVSITNPVTNTTATVVVPVVYDDAPPTGP